MHKMEKTPKIITIIGLIMEGISVIILHGSVILFQNLHSLPGLGTAQEADMTPNEYIDFMNYMEIIGNVILIAAIVLTVFFIVNIFLFTGLMKEKYTEEKAKKIYLYQAIWGGVNLISNQITGILYLISGVQGYNGRKDSVEVRDGL